MVVTCEDPGCGQRRRPAAESPMPESNSTAHIRQKTQMMALTPNDLMLRSTPTSARSPCRLYLRS